MMHQIIRLLMMDFQLIQLIQPNLQLHSDWARCLVQFLHCHRQWPRYLLNQYNLQCLVILTHQQNLIVRQYWASLRVLFLLRFQQSLCIPSFQLLLLLLDFPESHLVQSKCWVLRWLLIHYSPWHLEIQYNLLRRFG